MLIERAVLRKYRNMNRASDTTSRLTKDFQFRRKAHVNIHIIRWLCRGAEKARERLHVLSNLCIAYVTPVNKAEFPKLVTGPPWSDGVYHRLISVNSEGVIMNKIQCCIAK
jgi:hypothetical protein